MKLWGGRFQMETSKLFDEFGNSISYDYKLYVYDITGSIAHCKMLNKIGVLSDQEKDLIVVALEGILEDMSNGKIEINNKFEDIHMFVESTLIERIGEVGKKLHTGRSRNDQVTLDCKMYLKDQTMELIDTTQKLMKTIVDVSKTNKNVIMPGYTHMQRAQPVTFGFHLMTYFQMFKRDCERLTDGYKRIDEMPLGAGALAGVNYTSDREFVKNELGFAKITDHAMDSVSDRDYVIEFLSNASILMMHLSRICEELITWSTQEFNFVEISDAYSTGSSIMPQKKNPDTAELIRGKTGRVYGSLMQVLTVMKGLPLAYNKDMQEDKEALFDTVYTTINSVKLIEGILVTMTVNEKSMMDATEKGFLNATDVADYLVKKGGSFREAHSIVGQIVFYALEKEKKINELTLDELRGFSVVFEEDIYEKIDIKNTIEAKVSTGSTSTSSLKVIIEKAETYLNEG